ncbi:MAG: hypothetical protein B7733_21415, partial [Myxococcales bacterium FL481]
AAVTQLFYVNNWLHDYWYDSGFDEASGNAQAFNYGRGGVENDPVRAEAQDSAEAGFRDNANMTTPADGASPRMQMYQWTNVDVLRELTIDPSPEGYVGATGYAQFGPSTFDLTAEAVLANDGTEPVTDGCEEPEDDIAGKILVVESGATDDAPPVCRSVDRAQIAQAAGAVGLIYLGDSEAVPTLGSDPNIEITIPGLSLAKPDGDLLVAQLGEDDPTELTMKREARPDRDGTIDNQIVAHEWGHYLHHRLVLCGAHSCRGMSEGWADYVSLHMTVREDDDPEGLYPVASYATAKGGENNYYFGIRRYPYSTDMTKSPLSFRHIKTSEELPDDVPMQPKAPDNAQVHNVGEVWASMLHDAHMNLLAASRGPNARMSWEEAHRRMADYIVAGMKLTPVEPDFVQQRDAILAAAAAVDPDDMEALAEGFAKRGLGSCAVAPPPTSTNNEEAVEATGLQGKIEFLAWELSDRGAGAKSCDEDGVLDVGEQGNLRILVANTGAVPLESFTAAVSTTSPALTLAQAEVEIDPLAPHESTIVEIGATLADDTVDPQIAPIVLTLADPEACEPEIPQAISARINTDDEENASATDDVEAHNSAMLIAQTAGPPEPLWGRVRLYGPNSDEGHAWLGLDSPFVSDTSLVTPVLELTGEEPFVFQFLHFFQFESDSLTQTEPEEPIVHWDGGVLEISRDEGATWEDVSEYVDPGYGGTIGEYPNLPNPLAGRPGFVGQSVEGNQIVFEPLTLDFGTMLGDDKVRLRFRIGTDSAVGAFGWLVDDVVVSGISNTPFTAVVADDGDCDDDDDDDDSATGSDTGNDSGADTGDTGAATAGGDDDDDDDDDNGGGSGGDDDGCGCRSSESSGGPVGLAALLGSMALGMGRRRRARNSGTN